jgi:prephenate dehydratase
MTRVGYLGPEGTFSGEALATSPLVAAGVFGTVQPIALPTIHDTVVAVGEGTVERAIVPIENSLEGSVDVTLDALALDAPGVEIVAEAILPVRHCLIAREQISQDAIVNIVSHPQVLGQCARFIRSLGSVTVVTASSTAEAVRLVADGHEPGWAALGNRLAATLYGCHVLREGVEDHPDNETRFVWLAPTGSGPALSKSTRWKTSLVFWGRGAEQAGWLVSCLSELAERNVNLTRIESRPHGHGLGRYMFFADLEGRTSDAAVSEAVAGLRAHCDEARVLGSYPAAEA